MNYFRLKIDKHLTKTEHCELVAICFQNYLIHMKNMLEVRVISRVNSNHKFLGKKTEHYAAKVADL